MKNNIRVQRAVVRLTQQQLAEQVGVSRQTINAIESSKFIPSTLLALKIARTSGNRSKRSSNSKRKIRTGATSTTKGSPDRGCPLYYGILFV